MDEWWTYELSDLILFSSHTYYRLIELYNLNIWPLHIFAILFSFALLYLALQQPKHHGKIITAILIISWLWIAWAFLWQRFATIHWIASYYAIGFVIQSVLLFWAGILNDKFSISATGSIQNKIGLALIFFGLVIQPFLNLLTGHPWKAAELFALSPDTTIITTMGLILLTNLTRTIWLLVIPLMWCVVSAATLYALGSISAASLIIAALLTIVSIIVRKVRPSLIS